MSLLKRGKGKATTESGGALPQSLRMIVGAEVSRRLRSPGFLVALVLSMAVAGACIVGVTRFVTNLGMVSDFQGALTLAMPIGCFALANCLGLSVLGTSGRELADGTVLTSVQLVPDRLRLLGARCSCIAIFGAVVSFGWALGVAVVGLIVSPWDSQFAGDLALLVMCCTVTSTLVLVLAFLFISTVSSGVVAATALLLCFVGLPVISGATSMLGSGVWVSILKWVVAALPGSLMGNGVSPTTESPQKVMLGISGLLAWCYVFFVTAYARIKRVG